MTWPLCPDCRRPMWRGYLGAPVRLVHGCSYCNTRTDQPQETVELNLFEAAS